MAKAVKIGKRLVGEENPVFIVAEAGINHNGDMYLAKKLIEQAKEVGVDAIKFQSFNAKELNSMRISPEIYDFFKSVEFSQENFQKLAEYAKEVGITFLSTPFDTSFAVFLNNLGLDAFKIASGDITNLPLISCIAKFKKVIILSTGASTISEISDALDIIGNGNVILTHCVSSYPAPYSELNLKAIRTLSSIFNVPVGYSDHSMGSSACIAAVSQGAVLIEKHFTIDKDLPGPDHKLSCDKKEMASLVKTIREVEQALGSGKKRPQESEWETRVNARRSIVANCDIPAGTLIQEKMLSFKRPGIGLPPSNLNLVVGRTAKRDIGYDEPILFDMLE
jgi:N-acetylneuraminate synthase/N,N'-diacetyllegionaminate synthase